MKRVFGIFEGIFDGLYLTAALVLGLFLLLTGGGTPRCLGGAMALVLVGGDAFHLIPRMAVIAGKDEEKLRPALGRGKQITSISMTVFYLLLWQLGLFLFSEKPAMGLSYLVYGLAALRIFLCLLPQNGWQKRYPPLFWAILRNIPFFLLGLLVSALFYMNRASFPPFSLMWFSILLSFAFYLPVVLWANKNPKVGMLMLPKTCVYLWMLVSFLSL